MLLEALQTAAALRTLRDCCIMTGHRRETFGRSLLAKRTARRYLQSSPSVLPDTTHRKAACLTMIGDAADAKMPHQAS